MGHLYHGKLLVITRGYQRQETPRNFRVYGSTLEATPGKEDVKLLAQS